MIPQRLAIFGSATGSVLVSVHAETDNEFSVLMDESEDLDTTSSNITALNQLDVLQVFLQPVRLPQTKADSNIPEENCSPTVSSDWPIEAIASPLQTEMLNYFEQIPGPIEGNPSETLNNSLLPEVTSIISEQKQSNYNDSPVQRYLNYNVISEATTSLTMKVDYRDCDDPFNEHRPQLKLEVTGKRAQIESKHNSNSLLLFTTKIPQQDKNLINYIGVDLAVNNVGQNHSGQEIVLVCESDQSVSVESTNSVEEVDYVNNELLLVSGEKISEAILPDGDLFIPSDYGMPFSVLLSIPKANLKDDQSQKREVQSDNKTSLSEENLVELVSYTDGTMKNLHTDRSFVELILRKKMTSLGTNTMSLESIFDTENLVKKLAYTLTDQAGHDACSLALQTITDRSEGILGNISLEIDDKVSAEVHAGTTNLDRTNQNYHTEKSNLSLPTRVAPGELPVRWEVHSGAGTQGPVEVLLSPEDLGRLRFQVHHRGDSMIVVLAAERPETMDFLRRNAEQLTHDLRQNGQAAATLSFENWGNGGQHRHPHLDVPEQDENPKIQPASEQKLSNFEPKQSGLHLRL